jgi:peptide/bleomycin uptake transporter
MFRSFFMKKNWLHWSLVGSIAILWSIWYQVELSVQINDWYGEFYNMIQKALSAPNQITLAEFFGVMTGFLKLATFWILVQVGTSFFTSHYVFRWRTAMNHYYVENWPLLRKVEGAAQRVQEDTMRFASIVESLGVHFFRSILTLVAFMPILFELSQHITELPWIGVVEHSLIYIAILSAVFGTVVVGVVGIKLPGLEFNNQLVEAAYRKELVYGEDHDDRAEPIALKNLFAHVRKNYYRLYLHYGYFNFARFAYIQYSVLLPLIAMGPTIVAGAITFGLFRQITNAFEQVESSFQYLVNSWSTIVELISIYKRLQAFESNIRNATLAEAAA